MQKCQLFFFFMNKKMGNSVSVIIAHPHLPWLLSPWTSKNEGAVLSTASLPKPTAEAWWVNKSLLRLGLLMPSPPCACISITWCLAHLEWSSLALFTPWITTRENLSPETLSYLPWAQALGKLRLEKSIFRLLLIWPQYKFLRQGSTKWPGKIREEEAYGRESWRKNTS